VNFLRRLALQGEETPDDRSRLDVVEIVRGDIQVTLEKGIVYLV